MYYLCLACPFSQMTTPVASTCLVTDRDEVHVSQEIGFDFYVGRGNDFDFFDAPSTDCDVWMSLGHALAAKDSNVDHGLSTLRVDHTLCLPVVHHVYLHHHHTAPRRTLGHTVVLGHFESSGQTGHNVSRLPRHRLAVQGHTWLTVGQEACQLPEEVV